MTATNRVMKKFGGILKFVDKFLRGEYQGISRRGSHGSSAKTNLVLPKYATRNLSVPGDTQPLKTVKDMPGPSGLCLLPYVGSMFLMWPFSKFRPEKSNLLFDELHRKYGRIVRFRKGNGWSVLLFDPDLIQEVMMLEGKYPVRPSLPLAEIYCTRTRNPRGISQLQGEEWWRVRKPVQEFLLHPSNISQYIPALDEVGNDLIHLISRFRQEDGRMLLDNVMLRYAIESSALYCINARLGFLGEVANNKPEQSTFCQELQLRQTCSQNASYHFRQLTEPERTKLMSTIKMYMECVCNGHYTFPFYKFFRTNLYRDFEQASRYLSEVVHTRVTEVATSIKKTGQRSDDRPNLLQFLISDGSLDLRTCTSLLAGFFSTATDNVSNSLEILLWYLSKNPAKQNVLREEINRCVPSKNHVSSNALSHMPYLKACLKESHRLTFPTPFGSVRKLPQDVILGGYHIPAGTAVHFGHNVLGHSSKYFEDPEKYNPERWLKESETDALLRIRRSIITMPFGFGPRNCVGRRLAELQIYLAVIKILQHYKISLGDPNEEQEVVYKITASPSKPLDIKLHLI